MKSLPLLLAASAFAPWLGGQPAPESPAPVAAYGIIIRHGTVYDGMGGEARQADVGIAGDRIAAIGDLSAARASTEINARGLAVAPGFINMLSWSNDSLIIDGRSLSELKQGVTTQIMGEGSSMGPWSDEQKRRQIEAQGDLKFPIEWTTLAEYLRWLEQRGVAQNIASFVGAATVRAHVLGWANRAPTPAELAQMCDLVRREMEAGALGVGSALIYAPGSYASTEELIALCRTAAACRGKYITHIRGEGDHLIEAVEEAIRIGREARIPVEIYHLKAGGRGNWPKMDRVLELIEQARREGMKLTADMYTYTASSNGLAARLPQWALEGGYDALFQRLQDPPIRRKIAAEVKIERPEDITMVGFKSEALKPLTGQTLAAIAQARGREAVETALDLILEDRSHVSVVSFGMAEENLRKQLIRPWVSLGSDGASQAPEGPFLKSNPHPRAYGNFARFLGKYVREEELMPLTEGIRRLTGLPAANLELDHRGLLRPDFFADVVVFDPQTIADRATYENPHQFAVGVRDVLVNGVLVLKDGEPTGARPGRALYGPGKIR